VATGILEDEFRVWFQISVMM